MVVILSRPQCVNIKSDITHNISKWILLNDNYCIVIEIAPQFTILIRYMVRVMVLNQPD